MKIVVLAGGLSDERDVSLTSGSKVANALMEAGHQVLLMDLYLGFDDVSNFDEAYGKYKKDTYTHKVPDKEPDLDKLVADNGGRTVEIGPNVIDICKSADLAYLGLHGGIGENGKLQAVFEIFEIKYTGSKSKASMIAMDKITSKILMKDKGVLTPDWKVLTSANMHEVKDIEVPAVVKPNDNGSSIGVEIVETKEALEAAVAKAKKYSDEILIEKKITGREFSAGVLDGVALPIIEIKPKLGFYDYANKYQADATEEIVPAQLSEELTRKMQEAALRVFHILGMEVYGRIDFMLDENDDIYAIEANSLPGMTPTSLLPQEARANGMEYVELCDKIVNISYDRYQK